MNKQVFFPIGLSSLLALGSSSCAHKANKGAAQDPWEPDATDVARSGVELGELEQGLAIYRSHCGGCHMLYPVSAFSAQAWPKWVLDMSERARMDEAQVKTLTDYLVTIAGRNTNSPPSPTKDAPLKGTVNHE